ncbi:MAG: TatD family hydrolase [Candidatus Endonucleobacter bathymodioli]|uniref:TatD family hydrolase n=1 Tax=Candidatus Endonucleibacter bathymodioli TaxID=539814 RepID=A0AA90NP51_9GAMM|nr:TatD family hydrolase [Candidatus Endonucleobacter bathymodioli]
MSTLIDSHCHLDRLNLAKYDGSLKKAIAAAREVGVEKILCVGTDLKHADQIIELAETYSSIYASIGIHPLECKSDMLEAEELLQYASHLQVVGIGETGLDYYYAKENKIVQQSCFVAQLQVASQAKLPIIVHTRDAKADTLALIRSYACTEAAGVLHCFTESWDMAKAAMDMNFMISISGIVTFANASELRDVVKKIPFDRLLIETDAPYLAPVPHRGKPNEPAFLADVARYVAELKNISLEELAEHTTNNFHRLFNKVPR